MEQDKLDLVTLLERVPSATLTVQLSDLNTFSRRLIAETRNEFEQEIVGRIEARSDVFLTADTVKQEITKKIFEAVKSSQEALQGKAANQEVNRAERNAPNKENVKKM